VSTLCVVCSVALPTSTSLSPLYGCFACVGLVLGLLAELELMTVDLAVADHRRPAADTFGPRRPFYGPRVELDLAVVSALDPRTTPGEDDHVRSVLGTLHGINNALREERHEPRPPVPLLTRELAYLRSRITWCATRPDFGEVVADIRDLHRHVRLLTRRDRPQSVGRCPAIGGRDRDRPCGTRLEVWPDDPEIRCPTCGGRWARAAYLELAQQVLGGKGAVRTLLDRGQLAGLTGRSENTIRKHCTPARYRPVDGAALYDARDATAQLAAVRARTHRDTPSEVVDRNR
jgi:hypothetical protein